MRTSTRPQIFPRRRSRRGILLLDVMAGLAVMLVTLVLLANVRSRSQIVARRLADDRAAVHLAEATLLSLHANANTTIDERVRVSRLDEPAAPTGEQWAEVSATVNGRSVTVSGLIAALPRTTGGTP